MSRMRQWQTMEFRDGPREVPDHLAFLLRGMDTYRLTYLEAIQKANDSLFKDWLNGKQGQILRRHFDENRST